METSTYRRALLAILLLALAIRLTGGYWWRQRLPEDQRFGFADSESYWHLAQTIRRGEPYQFGSPDRRIFRTPGYPALLASMFWLLDDDDPPLAAAHAFNAVLGVLAVAAVIALARLLFDRQASLWAGLAAALYPGGVSMSVFVLSEAPFCPLMLLHLGLWAKAWREESASAQMLWAVWAGNAAAAAVLVRPSWLLFTPFALAIGWLVGGKRWTHVRVGVCMTGVLAAVMAPWWYRSYQLTGAFVPTTLQVGESLYDGLGPQATGGSDMRFVDRFRRELRTEDRVRGVSPQAPPFELRLDQRMKEAAVQWAKENPVGAVRLAGVKLVRMWNIWPNEPSLRSWPLRLAVVLGYTPLFLLGCWGIRRFAGLGWAYWLCFLPAVYFTLLHCVFVSSIRYRQPAMLPLIVLAAGVLAQWRSKPN